MSISEKSSSNASPRILGRPLRVLLVEDSEPDALLLRRALERGGFAPTTKRVYTAEALDQALREQVWDIILCDHAMPYFSAPEALETVQKHGLDVPFIIVSGYIEEETAIAAMKAGAHDYIMKDRLARLMPVVERELREAEVRRARRKSEADLLRAHEELEMRVEQRTADLRAANLKLENVIDERKRLENELLEIAENERRRIGFDLHDDLGQKLTGVSMMMKGLEQRLADDRHACRNEARKIQALMEDIINHTHNLAHQFSSLDVKGDDLATVLKGLAENVKKMFEIHCSFSVKSTLPELPKHTTVQLYKIAQEAVSNAIKHGKATQVSLSIVRHDDQLFLTIKNNGLPFSPPVAAKNRMGLRIMNYRANTIGARLEIQPLEKSGTLVTCALPCKSNLRPNRSFSVREGEPSVDSCHKESEPVHEAKP
ncbi:MAG TPA: response regulator [Candidatus Limnocylindrales bacterium]|nr:response regulator [Candidatus Limnocylindrales bacterium]